MANELLAKYIISNSEVRVMSPLNCEDCQRDTRRWGLGGCKCQLGPLLLSSTTTTKQQRPQLALDPQVTCSDQQGCDRYVEGVADLPFEMYLRLFVCLLYCLLACSFTLVWDLSNLRRPTELRSYCRGVAGTWIVVRKTRPSVPRRWVTGCAAPTQQHTHTQTHTNKRMRNLENTEHCF